MKKITICSNCGSPLIWTFYFNYRKMFCLNCGKVGSMFIGNEVDLTNELRIKQKIVNGIWKVLYGKKGDLIPANGMYKKDKCKKCEVDKYHGNHLTEKETQADRICKKVLKNLEGLLK